MRFLQVGLGRRSQAYRRVIADMDDLTCVGVVLRRQLAMSVPTFTDLQEALARLRPDFVLNFTPASTVPTVLRSVTSGVPVLTETLLARTSTDLDSLTDVASSGLAHVAEREPLMPAHAARLEGVRRGLIGEPTQAQISSAQSCHAMALIRAYLHVGIEPAQVSTARFFTSMSSTGRTTDADPRTADATLATIDFGGGREGVYDLSGNQTGHQQRSRLLVRGSRGEISGEQIVRLAAPTLITTTYLRHRTDLGLDMNGCSTKEITVGDDVLWTNPYPDQRWNDDEIAAAEVIRRMVGRVEGTSPGPYSLAEAVHDARLALAVEEAVETDRPILVHA